MVPELPSSDSSQVVIGLILCALALGAGLLWHLFREVGQLRQDQINRQLAQKYRALGLVDDDESIGGV